MANLLKAHRPTSRSPSPVRSKTSSPRGIHHQTPLSSKQTAKQQDTSTLQQQQQIRNNDNVGNESSDSSAGISKKIKTRHKSPVHSTPKLESTTSDSNASFAIEPEDILTVMQSISVENDSPLLCSPRSAFTTDSSEMASDDVDSSASRARKELEHIQNKILKTQELIRLEQVARDENVNEYLRSASYADKRHLAKIKQIFEKKNQKSAQNISQLQKKLDGYSKKLKSYELHGAQLSNSRTSREVFRDMGHGLKHVGGNIRIGLMSKPRAFAHLIKNKFGSADNINTLSRNSSTFYVSDPSRLSSREGSGRSTLPGNSSLGSGLSAAAHMKFTSEEGSKCSSVTSESAPRSRDPTCFSPTRTFGGKSVFRELQENQEDIDRFKEKAEGFQDLQKEISLLSNIVQEDRDRFQRMEEKITDLTKLQHDELGNLKRKIDVIEEKVHNQREDKMKDIHEMLENCQTKICEIENQQQQNQQYITLEGIENSPARALLVKVINIGLTILQVTLLLLATAAGIMMPFVRTSCTKPNCFMCRMRIAITTFIAIGIIFIMRQWSEIHEMGSHLVAHIGQFLRIK